MTGHITLPPLPSRVPVDKHIPTGIVIYGYTPSQMRDYAVSAVEAERERCAQLCEDTDDRLHKDAQECNGYDCSAAIRSQT